MSFDPTIISALLPIFLIILLGYFLRHRGIPGESFWPQAERLTYYLLFPALLVRSTATAEFSGATAGSLVIVITAVTLLVSAIVLLLKPWILNDGPGYSSIFQGSIRFNTYVGLAVAYGLYAQPGLSWAAVILSFLIPLVNVLCIMVLTRFGRNSQAGIGWIIKQLVRNPLIIACGLGIGLNLTGVGLPFGSHQVLDILSRAALPLGLLAVGAGLDFSAAHGAKRGVIMGTLIKLVIFPSLMAAGCLIVGVEGVAAGVAVVFAALPAAPSAYILARQLGGDGPLMANLLTFQTAVAVLTLPLVMGVLLPLVYSP